MRTEMGLGLFGHPVGFTERRGQLARARDQLSGIANAMPRSSSSHRLGIASRYITRWPPRASTRVRTNSERPDFRASHGSRHPARNARVAGEGSVPFGDPERMCGQRGRPNPGLRTAGLRGRRAFGANQDYEPSCCERVLRTERIALEAAHQPHRASTLRQLKNIDGHETEPLVKCCAAVAAGLDVREEPGRVGALERWLHERRSQAPPLQCGAPKSVGESGRVGARLWHEYV